MFPQLASPKPRSWLTFCLPPLVPAPVFWPHGPVQPTLPLFGGNMFHFECLQVQKVCVGLKLVVCRYEMGRTLLHPLHVLSPSLVEEQWQLQLGSGLSCWQKVLLNAREKRKCFICLAFFSQLFWQLPKEKSLIFFWSCFFLWGQGGRKISLLKM